MTQHYDLLSKRAVVTGGTSGIGLATARLLAASGATVIMHGLHMGECQEACRDVPRAIPRACDLGDEAARAAFCAQVMTDFSGQVDILVHNAGIYPANDLAHQSLTEYRRVFAINVEAGFDLTKRLLPGLEAAAQQLNPESMADVPELESSTDGRRRGAAIVFISSCVTRLGKGDSPAYVASKAALIGLANHLAGELGPKSIRVNTVLPGLVDTPGTRSVRKTDQSYEQFATQLQMIPHVIQPHDLAQAIVFLCSPAARAITAATLDVNGGLRVGG